MEESKKKEWLNKNAGKSQLLSMNIMSLNPDIGYYINVNVLDIPEEIFKEEYNIIQTNYFKVIDKLKEYYGRNKGSKNI